MHLFRLSTSRTVSEDIVHYQAKLTVYPGRHQHTLCSRKRRVQMRNFKDILREDILFGDHLLETSCRDTVFKLKMLENSIELFNQIPFDEPFKHLLLRIENL
uniref:Uncharacterized protein n=1 Tax=Romanomermis culicivorax TaxID=13658 RepID=A0A915IPU2_ROMCU